MNSIYLAHQTEIGAYFHPGERVALAFDATGRDSTAIARETFIFV